MRSLTVLTLTALLSAAPAVTALVSSAPVAAQTAAEQAAQREEVWRDLQVNVFDSRPMEKGDGVISLEAPARAEDAALVPMTIRFQRAPGSTSDIRRVTLLIDENPAPVAAEFTLGENAGVGEISTRVRVNAYTNVHAVAETSDGKLYVAERFVKASGGCSAPMSKDADEARANMGKMKFKQFETTQGAAGSNAPREAQVMIRHPNNSGLQMDQVSRLYIPAHFIRDLTIEQGGDLILKMEGGISLSEDPSIRFTYRPNGAGEIRVKAIDTEENVFTGVWPATAAAGAS